MKDNTQSVPDPNAEGQKPEELDVVVKDDIEMLNGITEKYDLTVLEKKVIHKIVSLLETKQMRRMLPKQNVGDSVFKMYSSDEEPTELNSTITAGIW